MNRAGAALRPSVQSEPAAEPIGRLEWASVAAYSLILLWINVYICRDLFFVQTGHMNSMHGFWMAIARWADGSWFRSDWWPYWDGGIPFEFTYAPLVPALTAIGSAIFHTSRGLAFQSVTALAYCLAPLTLLLMAWLMTRSAGYSFVAALFYSLVSPTQILVPDAGFDWHSFWEPRRLYLLVAWDDTPHMLAVALLPLAILFLWLSIRKRRLIYCAAASVSIAIATLASSFGPVMVMMAALCLLFVLRRENLGRNALLTVAIGAYAYALSAHFLPPSLLQAIRAASRRGEAGNWSMGSVTALAIVTLGWVLLARYLPRWISDWRLQFFAFFAYLTSSAPLLAAYLNRHLLPQPTRYKFEMELAWALLLVFGARYWAERLPRTIKAALLFLILALAGEQIVGYRQFAKNVLQPANLENTIEYRAATWAEHNLPGVRIAMPGSIAQWTNAFTPEQQFTGSSWSMAYNPVQQLGSDAVFHGAEKPEKDAGTSLVWLKAYGVGAVCVSGPKSPEFWKPYRHPSKFEDVLPVLWSDEDTTIYRVPERSASFAHVVPESAIVGRPPRGAEDTAGIERYVAALDDPSLPTADFQWVGRNGIRVHTTAKPEQAISLQVSYHPGWHVTVGNRHPRLRKDGLGLMWLQPDCNGPCEIQLEYDGGWELRLCRWISFLALAGLLVAAPAWYFRRARA